MSSDFGKLRYIFELLTPGLVFAADGTAVRARDRGGGAARTSKLVVTRNPPADASTTLFASLRGADADRAVDAAHAKVGPDTIAKFLFTSGSTGSPRA